MTSHIFFNQLNHFKSEQVGEKETVCSFNTWTRERTLTEMKWKEMNGILGHICAHRINWARKRTLTWQALMWTTRKDLRPHGSTMSIFFESKTRSVSEIDLTWHIRRHLNRINTRHWHFNRQIIKCNFHPLEVVCRWRDPQLRVSENYSDLKNWSSTILKSCWLTMSLFIFNMFKSWYVIMY